MFPPGFKHVMSTVCEAYFIESSRTQDRLTTVRERHPPREVGANRLVSVTARCLNRFALSRRPTERRSDRKRRCSPIFSVASRAVPPIAHGF